MSTLKRLVSRRWWWVTILVLLGMVVLARLGVWQLDRLQQRRAANAVLREQLAAAPLNLNEVDLTTVDLTTMADRAVVATGTFDFSQQILLKLQNFEGSTGGHLVAPLRLEGEERAILVDRGWIPMEDLAPERWSRFDETGTVTVEGVIRLTETARGVATPAAPQQEWYRINVTTIARQMPYEIAPVYLLQAPPPAGNSALPFRAIPQPDLSEGPHLSYAIQWFAFTLMLGGGYIYFVNRQEKRADAPAAEAQDAAPDT